MYAHAKIYEHAMFMSHGYLFVCIYGSRANRPSNYFICISFWSQEPSSSEWRRASTDLADVFLSARTLSKKECSWRLKIPFLGNVVAHQSFTRNHQRFAELFFRSWRDETWWDNFDQHWSFLHPVIYFHAQTLIHARQYLIRLSRYTLNNALSGIEYR